MSASGSVLERIKANKEAFIALYKGSFITVTEACEKVGISRETFYEWRKTDPAFSQALIESREHLDEEVEDMLMYKIFIDKDPASIRYYLSRRHPKFKLRAQGSFTGNSYKTLEDLLRESAINHIQQNLVK